MKKRCRHTLVFTVLRPLFRIYLRLRFNYKGIRFKAEPDVKGPYLILSNHSMAMDPFFLTMSFKEPIFFIASDMIFSIPIISKIISFLVQPIPKTKYRSDMETIRDTIKMVKSGGTIGVFPEGNATFHGELMEIPFAISKLIKLLKIPVLFYRIEGGYETKPRWAKKVRRGKMVGYVHEVWKNDDYKDMPLDKIYEAIIENLKINDVNSRSIKTSYGKKYLAEDIESSYFICPSCKSMHTLYSSNNDIKCHACSFHVVYTSLGYMENKANTHCFKKTKPWYDFQKEYLVKHLNTLSKNDLVFHDQNEDVFKVLRATKKIFLGKATMSLYKDRIVFEFKDSQVEWKLMDVQSAVQQKNNLILYNKRLEETYYLKSHEKRNALKYVLAIEIIQKEEAK